MKKITLLLLLLLMTISSLTLGCQNEDSQVETPPESSHDIDSSVSQQEVDTASTSVYGTIKEEIVGYWDQNKYINEYYDIYLTVPSQWHVMSEETLDMMLSVTADWSMDNMSADFYNAFDGSIYPAAAASTQNNIESSSNYFTMTAQESLVSSDPASSCALISDQIHSTYDSIGTVDVSDIRAYDVDGQPLLSMDIRTDCVMDYGIYIHQRFYVFSRGGYTWIINLCSYDESTDETFGIFDTLSFQ